MLLAESAILAYLHPVRMCFLILRSIVIPVLAFGTRKCYSCTHDDVPPSGPDLNQGKKIRLNFSSFSKYNTALLPCQYIKRDKIPNFMIKRYDYMKIKICGLTDPLESEYLNENRVDYAGMVLFYPKSKRNISPERASRIISALNPSILPVAVTVSPTADQVLLLADRGFKYIQIHGNIPRDLPKDISLPIIKAFNVNDLPDFEKYMQMDEISAFLMDGASPGSGRTFDWNIIKGLDTGDKLLILAGGLDPYNVKAAIDSVRPDAVDVSSGVEYDDRPGKDPAKISAFVKAARS